MEKYYNDGLLPDDYIVRCMFDKMLDEKEGTVMEACLKAAKEVIKEHKELLYSYSYELEFFADMYLEECRKGQATLGMALEYAALEYLTSDAFMPNVYIFLGNYVEAQLLRSGVHTSEVQRIRSYLLRFVDYDLLDTDLSHIRFQVDRYAKTRKLP